MRVVVNLPLGANLDPETLRNLLDAGRTIENRYATSCADVSLVLQSCEEESPHDAVHGPQAGEHRQYFTATLKGRMPFSICPGLTASLMKREE